MDKLEHQNLTYSEADAILQDNLNSIKRSYVAVGYYLKRIRDDELFFDGGYKSVWDYAEDRFGIKRTTASRWMYINDKFSEGGNSPNLAKEFRNFGKSQLQEMLYLEDGQLKKITPDMTVKEIREVRRPEKVEEDPVSILGYPLRVYPKDSLIATPGCGNQDCFSCHRDGCDLRQVDCYCVEAPMGNPFPCTTLNVVENLRKEVGTKCQFVNEDLAFHRAGDGQPVPCCKKCDNPCGYECNRSVQARHKANKLQQKEMCDVAQTGTCIHRPEFSCTLPETSKITVGDGIDCNVKCCWDCPKRIDCGYRCNSAAGHPIEEEQLESVTDLVENPTDETVIDAEYEEIAAENDENEEMCCENSSDLSELTFSQIDIRDYLEEEEHTLTEYEKVNSEDGGLPHNLMMRQMMLVKALRLLMENEKKQDEQEDDDEQEAPEPVQPELPLLRNNDQRKEWLNNYKEWPVWFSVPEASEVYHRFDLPDGSSVVICEYHMWLSWKERHSDENPDSIGTREYLLKPGYRYLQDCRTNISALVEHLKNIQKAGKK